jgi:nucleotide-binding universal stress UspA family protein
VDETIVVGVDGSEGGAAALEFAVEEAALRKTPLRIVSAWEVPVAAFSAGAAPLDPATLEAFRLGAAQIAEDAKAAAKTSQPSIEVQALTVSGQPADALLAQGAEAELIVVGRRGLGGFRSLLLGSVSQQVVHYAACPVVVVQHPAAAS